MSIKHEQIEVSGTVLYCDDCGKRGPESAYDNIDDTMDMAAQDGWGTDPENDERDLCSECLKKAAKPTVRDRVAFTGPKYAARAARKSKRAS